jgi:hypothetical protein
VKHLTLLLFFTVPCLAENPSHGISSQAIECSGHFESAIVQLREIYPVLERIVTGQIRQRLATAGPEWNQLENILNSCSYARCSISLDTLKFRFMGTVQIVTEDNKKVLELVVGHFIATELVNSSGARRKIDLKGQAKGPNFQFLYLISTIFTAIHRVLDQHPEVTKVRIKASRVVNRPLALAMEEMGFIPDKQSFSESVMLFFLKASPTGWTKMLSPAFGADRVNAVTMITQISGLNFHFSRRSAQAAHSM